MVYVLLYSISSTQNINIHGINASMEVSDVICMEIEVTDVYIALFTNRNEYPIQLWLLYNASNRPSYSIDLTIIHFDHKYGQNTAISTSFTASNSSHHWIQQTTERYVMMYT